MRRKKKKRKLFKIRWARKPGKVTLKNFIARECANHYRSGPEEIQNYCWFRKDNGFRCRLFSDPMVRCPYFEESVLPLRPDFSDFYQKSTVEPSQAVSEAA